jgi:D-alanyl-D-alanine dipeptidase
MITTTSAVANKIRTAHQLIIVTTGSWTGVNARLCCFERSDAGWTRQMGPFDVVVGRQGLAWDGELQGIAGEGPVKREGDGKAPAGMFYLLHAMGHAAKPPDNVTFRYEQIQPDMHCVDDAGSAYYNRIVSESKLGPGAEERWKSSEQLSQMVEEYRWLIVVDYNRQDPKPGAGSCIFMHLWRSNEKGTAGCTAMAEQDLLVLLQWLRNEKNPLLVQLPGAEYERIWKIWGLPSLEQLEAP